MPFDRPQTYKFHLVFDSQRNSTHSPQACERVGNSIEYPYLWLWWCTVCCCLHAITFRTYSTVRAWHGPLTLIRCCSGAVVHIVGQSDTNAVGRPRAQIPREVSIFAGDRGGDVGGGIAQIYREDLRSWWSIKQAWTERKDSASVRRGAFRQDNDARAWVAVK